MTARRELSKRRRHAILATGASQAGGESHGVLKRLPGALRRTRQSRMGRVAQQDDALRSPHRKRIAEIERCDERRRDAVDQIKHISGRAGEGPPQVLQVTGWPPFLAMDLCGGDETVERMQVRPDRKRHCVTARAQPRRERVRLEPGRHIGGRNRSPPPGNASEARLLFAEENRPHRGAQPISADHDVTDDLLAVLEHRDDAVGALLEGDKTSAGPDPLGVDSQREALEQVGAMHADQVNAAVALRPRRIGLGEDRLTAVHSPQLTAVDWHAGTENVLGGTKTPQHADPIWLDSDAGADLGHLRRLLQHEGVQSCLLQRDRCRHPGDSTANYKDAHFAPFTSPARTGLFGMSHDGLRQSRRFA